MGYLIFFVILGLIVGAIAVSRGRSFLPWFIYGTLFSLIAIINLLVIKNKAGKKCPKCLSMIDEEAEVCKYCRHHFTKEEYKNTANTIIDPNDDQYSLLFEIIDKNEFLNAIRIMNDTKVNYEDTEKKFQDFGKRIGKEIKSTEVMKLEDYYSLSTDDMRIYETFKQGLQAFRITLWYSEEYMKLLEDVNRRLVSGSISPAGAESSLDAGIKILNNEKGDKETERIKHKVYGELLLEEIIALRQKKPNATVEELMMLKVDKGLIKIKFDEELTKLKESDM